MTERRGLRTSRAQREVLDRMRRWQRLAIGGRLSTATVARWPRLFPPLTLAALERRGHVRRRGGFVDLED